MESAKLKVARLSVGSNVLLTLGKLSVGLSINSVSIVSEGIHSGLDLVAAIISYLSVRQSSKPADETHPYGHGKFENLAGVTEALLILAAAAAIIWQGVAKLAGHSWSIHSLGLGSLVMGGSALVNWLVSRQLLKVARDTDSPALEADGYHLRTDVYTSLGVFAGVLAIKLTGYQILDPLIAMGVSLLIIKAAIDLIRGSLKSMLDERLPAEDEAVINRVLAAHAEDFLNYHELRTRKAGAERYIDLHLVVPRSKAIVEAHNVCEEIEQDLRREFSDTHILIHCEPCDPICDQCKNDCKEE